MVVETRRSVIQEAAGSSPGRAFFLVLDIAFFLHPHMEKKVDGMSSMFYPHNLLPAKDLTPNAIPLPITVPAQKSFRNINIKNVRNRNYLFYY